MPLEVSPGVTLWRIDYTETRAATLWVAAPDYETARADAEVLCDEIQPSDFDDVASDFDVILASSPPELWHTYWSGGPDGAVVAWGDRPSAGGD